MKKNPSIYSQEDEYYTNLETHTKRENVSNSFVNITPKFSVSNSSYKTYIFEKKNNGLVSDQTGA